MDGGRRNTEERVGRERDGQGVGKSKDEGREVMSNTS